LEGQLHIDKPADQPVATAIFRAKRALSGRFSFGLSFECRPGTVGTAAITWCRARSVIVLNGLRWHARNLRLPARIGAADRFALQVQANVWLKISFSFHSEDASEKDFEIETGADPAAAPTECADGTGCEDSAPGEDRLAVGYLPVAAKRRRPLFMVRAVRPASEAAVMQLSLRRPPGAAAARQVLVRVTAGDERRLVIIQEGRVENSVAFRLRPSAAQDAWPVTLETESALEWSGAVRRGFDEVALPAYSLEEV
jgi:hypothetical protein